MSFFDKNISKELNNDYDFENDGYVENDTFDEMTHNIDVEISVNKRNQDEFDNLMSKASSKYDFYWDANNPLIKLFLAILFIVIVVGLLYYVFTWYGSV